MSDGGLICASMGVLGVTIIGIFIIYISQKKEKSLYNKVIELIDNSNIKKIINLLSVLTLIMICLLLIGLGLSIFLPSVEWGWIDRNTLITTFATILGGYFGLIGASIGILGTYGAFYLGANKEKEEEQNFKRVMLFNLLECSLDRTIRVVNKLNDLSTNYGINIYKDEDEEICKRVRTLMEKVSKNEYDQWFRFAIMAIVSGGMKGLSTLPRNKYGYRLQEEFKEAIEQDSLDLSDIIYDENWTSYLDCLKDSKDIQNIINWLNLLRSNAIGYNVIDFLCYRNNIIKIIDENEPSVKDGSIRGVLERGRKVEEEFHFKDF